MSPRWWHVFSSLVVAVTLAGCRSRLPVEVSSLRENLPELEGTALAWRADAYLESAEITLRNGNPTSWSIWAHFNSPSTQYESLVVRMLPDGSTEIEVIPHTVPVPQIEAIRPDDWTLDSEDALRAALDEGGLAFLQEHGSFQCGDLELERLRSDPSHPLVWRLSLSECLPGGEYLPEVLVDPNTGEILGERDDVLDHDLVRRITTAGVSSIFSPASTR